ncbi:MAG: flippase, partial [Planctomycetes bacterium]|nr:flippase [Planctomycetota bacterium]
ILLNCVLIPPFGIAGAAIATAASLGIKNVMWTVKLYSLSNIHPFTKSFLKPVIVSSIPIFIIYMIATNLFDPAPLWLLPIIGVVFTGVYVAAVLFTKSIDQEELEMLLAVESRLGINLGPLRKVLSRFT